MNNQRRRKTEVRLCTTSSETTIYQDVLQEEPEPDISDNEDDPEITFKVGQKKLRESSSSDDRIDTSDELMEIDVGNVNDQFIADCASDAKRRRRSDYPEELDPEDEARRRAVQQTEKVIRQAEANQARIHATPGKEQSMFERGRFPPMNVSLHHSAMVDDHYMAIGGHVDATLRERIRKGEYIDFARLLPKTKVANDEGRMELVSKGGQTFFVPADHETVGINSFSKWEQAFRIFSNIYSQEHPDRSSELIQYNHVIFTAAQGYIWDNVYQYDREFRTHLSFFPDRNWGIILQQAWAMCLKDKINHANDFKSNNNQSGKKDVCLRYNRGLCMKGRGCRYEHKCLECGKFGHGAHICRKRLNKQKEGGVGSNQQQAGPSTSKMPSHGNTGQR